MKLSIEDIESSAFQNFRDYVRNEQTLKNYQNDLVRFLDLIPNAVYDENQLEPPKDKNPVNQTEAFVALVRSDVSVGKSVILAYVRELKKKIESGAYSPARVINLIKPIKALFAANDIDFSWKKIDKSIPKAGKSQDKAYTRTQLQMMMAKATDLVDKIMITLCSSAGFRVEAWDYFLWEDVVFFYNEDGTLKGGALRVYRGDDEEYWTHFTPEAGKYLLLYKEFWKDRFGRYPKESDPMISHIRSILPRGLGKKGIEARMRKLAKNCGLRPPLKEGQKRHKVMLDHGLRKYFNTMCRRAKINFADKEELQGREASKNESHYERYEESDFERFSEYQKAIPFLTIDDSERKNLEIIELKEDNDVLNLKVRENEELKDQLKEERQARIKFENDIKKTLADLREEKLSHYESSASSS